MEYKCNHCNKNYASYQSRCNHIRRYHKVDLASFDNQSNHDGNQKSNQLSSINNDVLKCKKCNKEFTFKQNRWRHEQTCDKKITEIQEI